MKRVKIVQCFSDFTQDLFISIFFQYLNMVTLCWIGLDQTASGRLWWRRMESGHVGPDLVAYIGMLSLVGGYYKFNRTFFPLFCQHTVMLVSR